MPQLVHIVHVDDDDDILTLTKMSLEYFGGMVVTQFRSGREALNAIERTKADLLLLDVMMPDMDGMTLFRAIRNLSGFTDIGVVFMTAKAELLKRHPPQEPGVLGIIGKPFDTLELPDLLRALWSGQTTEPARKKSL